MNPEPIQEPQNGNYSQDKKESKETVELDKPDENQITLLSDQFGFVNVSKHDYDNKEVSTIEVQKNKNNVLGHVNVNKLLIGLFCCR